MQETRNNCFGSKIHSTTLRQAKTGKPDEGLSYVFSNNCCKFLASYGVIFQSVIKSYYTFSFPIDSTYPLTSVIIFISRLRIFPCLSEKYSTETYTIFNLTSSNKNTKKRQLFFNPLLLIWIVIEISLYLSALGVTNHKIYTSGSLKYKEYGCVSIFFF